MTLSSNRNLKELQQPNGATKEVWEEAVSSSGEGAHRDSQIKLVCVYKPPLRFVKPTLRVFSRLIAAKLVTKPAQTLCSPACSISADPGFWKDLCIFVRRVGNRDGKHQVCSVCSEHQRRGKACLAMLMSSGFHKGQRCSKPMPSFANEAKFTQEFCSLIGEISSARRKRPVEAFCRELGTGWVQLLKNKMEQVRYGWGLERMLHQKLPGVDCNTTILWAKCLFYSFRLPGEQGPANAGV